MYKQKTWVEISPPLERWLKEEGGTPIPSKLAPNLLHISKNKISETGDGVHYTREIGLDGNVATKVIYGFNSNSTYNKVISRLEKYTGFKNYDDFKTHINSLPELSEELDYLDNHPNKSIAIAMEVVIQIGNLWDDGCKELTPKMRKYLYRALQILQNCKTKNGQIKSLIRNGNYYYRNMDELKMYTVENKATEWGVTYGNYGRVLESVDGNLFTCEEYTIPEGVEVMEYNAFYGQTNLRRIHLPSTLREMGDNAFIHCSIESIEFPEGMTEIPGSACEVCKELKAVRLPATIKGIGIGAFNGCDKLEEINLPDSIQFMEDNVFSGCASLKHVTLPEQLSWIAPELFDSSGIESITIPNNITEIGYWAFWGCDNLKSLTIPESVILIGRGIVSAHEGFEGVVCHAPGYHVENEALIEDKTGTLLCCWTNQKDYIVPECVNRIADFSLNDFVETITVKLYVEIEYHDTFASNHNLKKIDFQGGVGGKCENIMDNKGIIIKTE